MKVYEDFKLAASGTRLYCPECGQPNPADNETCDECGATLLRPASLWQNLLDVIIRPLQGMKRVAATAPIMQALLVVILGTAIQFVVRALGVYQFWNYYFLHPERADPDFAKANPDYIKLFAEGQIVSNAPEPWQFFASLLIYIVSWLLFAGGIYLVTRFFYKDARLNYTALLPVVGFSRVAYLATLLLVGILIFVPDAQQVVGLISLLPLAWQLFLMIVGVRSITGLNWNRATIIVMAPALLFYFLVPIPF